MSLIKCPECGREVSDRAKTCPHCGVGIAGEITTCPGCGEAVFKDDAECPHCHYRMDGAGTPAPAAPLVTLPKHQADEQAQDAQTEAEQPAAGPAKKPKRGYTAFIVALVIALIIVLLGLYFYQHTQAQNELRAYQNALTSAEPAVLDNFLAVYPDAPKAHRDSIESHLNELKKIEMEWAAAMASCSRNAFERYVERYPGNVHVTEAKLKIDSLDYDAALQANTADAFQHYMDLHADGYYYDEARQHFEQLDALRLKAEERESVATRIQQLLTAFSNRDEAAVNSLMASTIVAFMGKDHPAADYPVQWMKHQFEADVTAISFALADDWTIEKRQPAQEGAPIVYAVAVSVDQRIDRTDDSRERVRAYRLSARLLPDFRIQSFNLQKVER